MQRAPYQNPPPAHSPPLHHPVPQHVSTVPQLRSPPLQQQQQQAQQQGYGYAQQGGAPGMGSQYGAQFGNFMNDPTSQMGLQMGRTAMMAGQEYMEQNINRWFDVNMIKPYFNVSNSYVLRKLWLVLFPWRHRPWSRQQRMGNSQTGEGAFLPPREDINSPDMYIPVMAFVTFVLLSTLLAGIRGQFRPELLGLTGTTAFAIVIIEILGLKFGCYLLSVSNDSQLMDLVAYSGYKFVGIIVTLVVGEIFNRGRGTGGWLGWAIFLYTFAANAFFLLRSLKYVLLPESGPNTSSGASYTIARTQRNRRTQFLFVYSYVVQFFFMWLLSRQDSGQASD